MFRRSRTQLIFAISILMVAAIMSGANWWNEQRRVEALNVASEDARHLSLVLAQLVTRSLQSIDLITIDVARQVSLSGNLDTWRGAEGREKLEAYVSGAPQIRTMIVFDVRGRIVGWSSPEPVNPRVDISTRTYFIEMRKNRSRDMRSVGPFRNRNTGTWSMGFFRAVLDADGEFLGLVYAALNTEFIQEVFSGSQIWPGGSFALLNDHGIMIAASPHREDIIGKSFADRSPVYASGVASHVGIVQSGSGNKRIIARHKTSGYPFIVAAGRGVDSALVDWRRQTGVVWVAAGLLSALILFAAFALIREQSQNARLRRRSQELFESRERYALVESAVNEGIWDWNILNDEDYLSPRWKNLLGYEDDELTNVASTFFDLVHPEDKEMVSAAVEAHFSKKVPYVVEARLRRKDGDYHWFLMQGEAQRDDEGRPVRMVGTIADITERRQAEETLRDSEARFRAIAEATNVPTVITRKSDGVILFANPATETVTGISTVEFVGHKGGQNWENPEDRERFVAELASAGRVDVMEIRTRRAIDNQVRDTLVSAQEINYQDEQAIISTFVDVTDRKEAERAARESDEKFSRIMAIAPDAIIATDGQRRIQIFNQGAENVFGYRSDEVTGQVLEMLIPERFRQHHAGHVGKFMESDSESQLMSSRTEVYGLRKDGTEFPAEASISKLKIGKDVMLTVMMHDVSERKQAEIELMAARDKAEYADRAKSEFLANMSHELRTPLNAIIGFSQMMQQKTFGPLGDAHYDDYSRSIFESGDHLLSLINDILDISKIEAGQVELHEQKLDVPVVIQDCLRLIEPRCEEARLQVRQEISDGLPFLWGDERITKQMFINILSNAVKFTPAGGQITIGCQLTPEGGMAVSVTDTGIGIAKSDIPKAMSTFGQVDGSLGRAFEGTGLGLPLVKSLAELHQGKFEISSEPGAGTRASIVFPPERVLSGNT